MNKLGTILCGFLFVSICSDFLKIAEAKPFFYFPFRLDYKTETTDQGKVQKFIYDDPFTGIRYKGEFTPTNWTIPEIDLPKTITFTKAVPVPIKIDVKVNVDKGSKSTESSKTSSKGSSSTEKKEDNDKKADGDSNSVDDSTK